MFFVPCFILYSQVHLPNEPYSWGIRTGYFILSQNAEFKELPGVPNCCPEFKEGDGFGIPVELFFDYDLTENIGFGLSFGYNYFSGILDELEIDSINLDEMFFPATVRHNIETTFHNAQFGLYIFLALKPLRVKTGLNYTYLVATNYNQWEELVTPANRGTFENGRRIRNESEGEIPGTNPGFLSFMAGVTYSFPINELESRFLEPEISYRQGFTSILTGSDWLFSEIRFTIGLRIGKKTTRQTPLTPIYE